MRYGRDVIVARNVIPVDTAYGDNKRKVQTRVFARRWPLCGQKLLNELTSLLSQGSCSDASTVSPSSHIAYRDCPGPKLS